MRTRSVAELRASGWTPIRSPWPGAPLELEGGRWALNGAPVRPGMWLRVYVAVDVQACPACGGEVLERVQLCRFCEQSGTWVKWGVIPARLLHDRAKPCAAGEPLGQVGIVTPGASVHRSTHPLCFTPIVPLRAFATMKRPGNFGPPVGLL